MQLERDKLLLGCSVQQLQEGSTVLTGEIGVERTPNLVKTHQVS